MQELLAKIKKIGVKNLLLIGAAIVMTVVLIWYGATSDSINNPKDNVVNRAQVAKAVTLLFHSMDEIEATEKDYFLSKENAWYEKYMNMMYADTYYSTKEITPTERAALDSFTYNDLSKLFTNMGVVDKELMAYVKNNRAGNAIRLDEWTNIYADMVEKLDVNGEIKSINLVVAGTISNDETIGQWQTKTTYGDLGFEGLALDYYIDKGITVLLKDDEIICVKSVYSENVTYHNSWIISMSGGVVKAYIEGAYREFIASDKTSIYNNVVADIILEGDKLKDIKFMTDTISGKVMASSGTDIEIEKQGVYQVDDDCKVYKIYGNITMSNINDVLVGYDGQKFVLNDEGKIVAVVMDRDLTASNIRVLIKTDGYKELLHDYVTISAEDGCRVSYNNGTGLFELEPGEEFTFKPDADVLKEGRIVITSNGIDGRITINSLTRGYGTPSYRGSIELVVKDGKLAVVNELPLEQYLYSVVPSEMPWSYNYEALKAQAICARSFAYIHILNNGYSEYGAHVDDSTSYQVYGNAEEQTVTNAAVDETYGQVLVYGDKTISAYFFSTSCGATTTSAVWGTEAGYTQGKLLTDQTATMNLTDENTFDAFIRTNYKTYDSDYPWYRWSVSMTLTDITAAINKNISSVKAENVQVLNDRGQWVNKSVDTVGEVKKIETGERGQGGVLEYITIFGTECTVRVYKEYNIRTVLSPEGMTINRSSGDEYTTATMLPSGFFILEDVTDNNLLYAYNIIGGGYGHGVGMSQNAANYMAKSGKNSTEILQFFYTGVELSSIY